MLRNVLRHQLLDCCCCIAKLLARSSLHTFSKPLDSDSQALHLVRECCRVGTLEQARRLHSRILQSGVQGVRIFSKYLIRMYASCGSLHEARKAFEDVQQPDVISWTEIITAYARNGMCDEAFFFFRRMLHEGAHPDIITVLAVLYACKDSTHLEQGKLVHGLIVESGYEMDMAVGDRLLLMYVRCGGSEDREKLFLKLREGDAVSASAVMKIFMQKGDNDKALKLFRAIESPQKIDFVTALEACSKASQVKEVHEQIHACEMEVCSSVASALVEAYVRCGSGETAVKIVRKRWSHDPSCWTNAISAFARQGREKLALDMFHKMQRRPSVKPVAETFVAVLDACAGLGALMEGKLIHRRIVEEEKLEISSTLASSLVNMYSKCVSLEDACSVFSEASSRDVNLWNALIEAFSAHGQGYVALTLYQKMQQEGFRPDDNTFSSMLSVLSHHCLFQAGFAFFTMMKTEYNVAPSLSNLICMTELLGRAGELDEAYEMIDECPFKSSAVLWTSYLSACRSRGDVDRGKQAAVRILSLDPSNSAALVVLSRVYEWEGRSDISEQLRKMKVERLGQGSAPARSWIEINGIVHEFTAGDRSHPQAEEIHATVMKLAEVIEVMRAVDVKSLVMHDVEEEDEECLWFHSERLALVQGLMNTEDGERLVIFKSGRVCGDCHDVVAAVSKVSQREIVMRDSARFHRFSAGACSCGNFW